MAVTEFSAAINQLATERGISVEAVLETVRQALVAAYRKDFEGSEEEVDVQLDSQTGEARVFKEGKDVTPAGFGRIAAQTAKQVILQRIREEEKSAIKGEFEKKRGSIVSGYIFRLAEGVVFVDLGKTQGILPPSEQIPGEEYQSNQRIKVLVKEVQEGSRGPEILLSRTDPEFVKELFALEVPEVPTGVVKIERIAREAGRRTKMAVSSSEERVDPVGSCVGQKGVRVQSVTRELGEEKVDIVPFSHDKAAFIASALSPAKVLNVKLREKSRTAEVEVPEDQLSLAIGKEGQNVRLAAKLTGWRIDIKGAGKVFAEGTAGLALTRLSLPTRVVNILTAAGINTPEELKAKTEKELKAIKGLGPKALKEIKTKISDLGIAKRSKEVEAEEPGEGDKAQTKETDRAK